MKRQVFGAIALLSVVAAASVSAVMMAQEKPAGRTLKVKLSYTGSGTVDEKHLIQVFVFDTPNFTSGQEVPIMIQSSSTKEATLTFSDVDKSPLYLTAAYDPRGGYNEVLGPPPSGSSLGLHANGEGVPEPIKIEPGSTVEIALAFDDSNKMP